ncbi:hypothetical protein KAR91_71910 [Candidatus Pacearchaeota archaeon]|nr:hypothetical protein [Candidatus Pacearchaeota archaeon]
MRLFKRRPTIYKWDNNFTIRQQNTGFNNSPLPFIWQVPHDEYWRVITTWSTIQVAGVGHIGSSPTILKAWRGNDILYWIPGRTNLTAGQTLRVIFNQTREPISRPNVADPIVEKLPPDVYLYPDDTIAIDDQWFVSGDLFLGAAITYQAWRLR